MPIEINTRIGGYKKPNGEFVDIAGFGNANSYHGGGGELVIDPNDPNGLLVIPSETDKTFELDNYAADAKAVGDALTSLKNEVAVQLRVDETDVDEIEFVEKYEFDTLKDDLTQLESLIGSGTGEGLSANLKQNWAKSIRQETAFVSTAHPYTDALLNILEGGSSDGGETDDPVIPPDDEGVSDGTTWTDGVPYTFDVIKDKYYMGTSMALSNYNGWDATPLLYCKGASKIVVSINVPLQYCVFADADNKFLRNVYSVTSEYNAKNITIPSDASYVGFSGTNSVIDYLIVTPYA